MLWLLKILIKNRHNLRKQVKKSSIYPTGQGGEPKIKLSFCLDICVNFLQLGQMPELDGSF